MFNSLFKIVDTVDFSFPFYPLFGLYDLVPLFYLVLLVYFNLLRVIDSVRIFLELAFLLVLSNGFASIFENSSFSRTTEWGIGFMYQRDGVILTAEPKFDFYDGGRFFP